MFCTSDDKDSIKGLISEETNTQIGKLAYMCYRILLLTKYKRWQWLLKKYYYYCYDMFWYNRINEWIDFATPNHGNKNQIFDQVTPSFKMSPHNLLGTYMIIFEHEYDNIFFINSYVVYVYYYNIDKMKKRILPIPELPQVPPLSEFMNQSKCNVNSFYIYTLCKLLK